MDAHFVGVTSAQAVGALQPVTVDIHQADREPLQVRGKANVADYISEKMALPAPINAIFLDMHTSKIL